MRSGVFVLLGIVSVVFFGLFLSLEFFWNPSFFSSLDAKLPYALAKESGVLYRDLHREEGVMEGFPASRTDNYPGAGSVSYDIHLAVKESARISRLEVQRLIESFGVPEAEDLAWILKDPREKEFSRQMDQSIGKEISQEVRDEIMESARLAWFRIAALQQGYAVGTIDFDFYMLAMEEMARMDKEVVARNLSDAQYVSLMGEPKTARGLFETYPNEALPAAGYLEMRALFPGIRNEHQEVRSPEDVYRVVPKEVVEEAIRIDRGNLLRQRELQRRFLGKKISQEDFDRELDVLREETEAKMRAVLSEYQLSFLFGEIGAFGSDPGGRDNQ